MANMDTIRLNIEVDAGKGTETVKKFSDDVTAATKKVGDSTKEGGRGLGQFAGALDDTAAKLSALLTPTNLLGAGIGVGLVAAMDSAIASAMAYGDEIRRLQLITGASTEELSALSAAQTQLGGSSETLQRAMFLMSREIEAGGIKLSEIGISIRDSNGAMKNEVQLLYEVSDALSSMSDRAMAASKARQVFGRGAADLLPLLLAGQERIKELGLSAEELGVSLSAGATKALFDAKVATNVFDMALLGVKNTIAMDFLPAHELMVESLTAAAILWIKLPPDIRLLIELMVTLTASVVALGIALTALKAIATTGIFTSLLSTFATLPAIATNAFASIVAMGTAAQMALVALGPALAALLLTAVVAIMFDLGGVRTNPGGLYDALTTWVEEQIRALPVFGPILVRIEFDLGDWQAKLNQSGTDIGHWLGGKIRSMVGLPAIVPPSSDEGSRALARVGAPVGEIDIEKTIAEKTILMHLDQQLAQAETDLAKATLPALEAQLVAIQNQNKIKLEGLAIEAMKYKDDERHALVEKARQDQAIAGLAMENKIRSDIAVLEFTRVNTTEQLKAKAALAGEDLLRREYDLTVDLAEKTLADRLQKGLSAVEANRAYNKVIEDADSKLQLSLIEIDAKRATARAALNIQDIDATVATQKQIETIGLAGVDADKKALDLKLKNFQVTDSQFVDLSEALAGQTLQIKLAAIQKEEDADRAKAAQEIVAIGKQRLDATDTSAAIEKINKTLNAQLLALQGKRIEEGIALGKGEIAFEEQRAAKFVQIAIEANHSELAIRLQELDQLTTAHLGNSAALQVIDAQRLDAIQKDRDAEIAAYAKAELLKTGLLQDALTRRIAMEAEGIRKVYSERQKVLDDSAVVLEDQARKAGDLDAAFTVGFAHAATAADDAYKSMAKAGADTYASLKSGASDFLYETISTSGKIGDIFVNLGKRILRSMTDAFAEIAAKQAVMAAGFSLTGVLGIAGGASADVIEQARVTAAANAELGIFTDTVTTSTESLTGLTGVLGLVMRTLTMFGNGLLSFLGFFGNIVSGIASGGGIVETISSAFSGLVTSGGALYSIFNGLSNVGSALFSVFTEGTSLANVFQATFDALGLTSGGFGGVAAANGGTIGTVNAAGSFASFLGEWVPIAGALYMAAMAIQNFLNGDAAVKIGTAIGLVFAGPFGAYIGGIIGGLFANDPIAKLKASIAPFDRNAIGSTVGPGDPRRGPAQVGAGIVDIGGSAIGSSDAGRIELALAAALNDLLSKVVKATVLMVKTLPPTIGAQLDAALTEIETNGLLIQDWRHKGAEAGHWLEVNVKALMDTAIQAMTTGLGFGTVDLKKLGFDPKDPHGDKGGEVARGFEAMMTALAGLSAIVKEAGPTIDLTNVSLADFTTGAIGLFTAFKKEGEAFIDTVKRVMRSIAGIAQVMEQNTATIAAATGDFSKAFTLLGEQVKAADDRVVALADALTVAAESGSSPEEVLAAAQAVQQAIQAELSAIKALKDALDSMRASIVSAYKFAADLTVTIDGLRDTALDFSQVLHVVGPLWRQFADDVKSRVQLFNDTLALAASDVALFAQALPTLRGAFHELMDQISAMASPTDAIAALQDLAKGIESGMNAAIQATQASFAAQRTAAQAASQERINQLNAEKAALQATFAAQKTAIEGERTLLTKNYDLQKQALQTALSLSQQWASVLQSVKSQLVDLFNLLAPTHPLTSLNDVRAQFEAANAQFQAAPTAAGATQVQDLAKQLLQLAQQTPGYDLPSTAFQSLAGEVQAALEGIQAFAAAQPSQEQIQAQIAELDQQQADSLASIDARISAIDASQSTQLAAIDGQIASANADLQSTLSSLSSQEQDAIRQLQVTEASALAEIRDQLVIRLEQLRVQEADAQAALQTILGDQTYEQFIADKQAQAVAMLGAINATLQDYLGALVGQFVPGFTARGVEAPTPLIPALASGGIVTRPMFALIGESGPEAVIPLNRYAGSSGGGSSTVTITLSPTIQIQGGSSSQMKSDLDKALVELVNGPSLTRPALLELAKRAS